MHVLHLCIACIYGLHSNCYNYKIFLRVFVTTLGGMCVYINKSNMPNIDTHFDISFAFQMIEGIFQQKVQTANAPQQIYMVFACSARLR